MTKTIVLQSHRSQTPNDWLTNCMQSVRTWAASSGFDYGFEDDAFFDRLPTDIREKTAGQIVVGTDIARLLWAREQLTSGYDCVVWMDADMFITQPERCILPSESYALGREVWVQPAAKGRGWRSYKKVHNAFLLFRVGNSFLDFYLDHAQRIVRNYAIPSGAAESDVFMVPQLIGPKLLTALHNVVGCPVAEWAGMLSPAVALDLLAGGGKALDKLKADSAVVPAAFNLCGSSVRQGELTATQMLQLTDVLQRDGVLD